MKKLVRDLIPEIAQDESLYFYECKSQEEFRNLLWAKLNEETGEFLKSGELEELVDIIEVVDCILKFKGVTWEELHSQKVEKNKLRGSFNKRWVLDSESTTPNYSKSDIK